MKLIDNTNNNTMYVALVAALKESDEAYWASSWIMKSGVRCIEKEIRNFIERNGKGKIKILFSMGFGLTEADAIKSLARIIGMENLRYYDDGVFHMKAYLFKKVGVPTVAIIGSSNLSKSALDSGVEWNIESIKNDESDYYKKYNNIWDRGKKVDDKVIERIKKNNESVKENQIIIRHMNQQNNPQYVLRDKLISLLSSKYENEIDIGKEGTNGKITIRQNNVRTKALLKIYPKNDWLRVEIGYRDIDEIQKLGRENGVVILIKDIRTASKDRDERFMCWMKVGTSCFDEENSNEIDCLFSIIDFIRNSTE